LAFFSSRHLSQLVIFGRFLQHGATVFPEFTLQIEVLRSVGLTGSFRKRSKSHLSPDGWSFDGSCPVQEFEMSFAKNSEELGACYSRGWLWIACFGWFALLDSLCSAFVATQVILL